MIWIPVSQFIALGTLPHIADSLLRRPEIYMRIWYGEGVEKGLDLLLLVVIESPVSRTRQTLFLIKMLI
jgi:hypothetical protein